MSFAPQYFNKLSLREKEIATLIVEGHANIEISKKLGIKPNTVSTIKKKVYHKLGVSSAVALYKILTD